MARLNRAFHPPVKVYTLFRSFYGLSILPERRMKPNESADLNGKGNKRRGTNRNTPNWNVNSPK